MWPFFYGNFLTFSSVFRVFLEGGGGCGKAAIWSVWETAVVGPPPSIARHFRPTYRLQNGVFHPVAHPDVDAVLLDLSLHVALSVYRKRTIIIRRINIRTIVSYYTNNNRLPDINIRTNPGLARSLGVRPKCLRDIIFNNNKTLIQ